MNMSTSETPSLHHFKARVRNILVEIIKLDSKYPDFVLVAATDIYLWCG